MTTFVFRWRSLHAVSVLLFLLYGLLNFVLPIYVPSTLHARGPWAGGGLVLTTQADQALLGAFAGATQSDAGVSAFLVAFMDTMCAEMMMFAILQIAVVWFAWRRGQRWALFALALADLAIIPYFLAITQTYARFGVAGGAQFMNGMWVYAVLVLAAAVLGWFGLRQTAGQGSRARQPRA